MTIRTRGRVRLRNYSNEEWEALDNKKGPFWSLRNKVPERASEAIRKKIERGIRGDQIWATVIGEPFVLHVVPAFAVVDMCRRKRRARYRRGREGVRPRHRGKR